MLLSAPALKALSGPNVVADGEQHSVPRLEISNLECTHTHIYIHILILTIEMLWLPIYLFLINVACGILKKVPYDKVYVYHVIIFFYYTERCTIFDT